MGSDDARFVALHRLESAIEEQPVERAARNVVKEQQMWFRDSSGVERSWQPARSEQWLRQEERIGVPGLDSSTDGDLDSSTPRPEVCSKPTTLEELVGLNRIGAGRGSWRRADPVAAGDPKSLEGR
ncbi:MAG: hypothetical protein KF901_14995 [Myxococcales bacterium]|nr:hypothetical protein [Myxococcales bacterium]